MSHSSLLTNNQGLQIDPILNPTFVSAIPIALIIGICVCILALLVLLFITVIYCIRKKNFKICKTLLNHQTMIQHCDKPL